jgi:hypothetical protein
MAPQSLGFYSWNSANTGFATGPLAPAILGRPSFMRKFELLRDATHLTLESVALGSAGAQSIALKMEVSMATTEAPSGEEHEDLDGPCFGGANPGGEGAGDSPIF